VRPRGYFTGLGIVRQGTGGLLAFLCGGYDRDGQGVPRHTETAFIREQGDTAPTLECI
jgi:hypothetical protein